MTPALERMIIKTREFLGFRSRAYKLTFGSLSGQEVLMDLMRFCRANETCVIPGDRDRSLVLEGRREVWLRIANHMHLTTEQLYQLLGGANIQVIEGEKDADTEE